MDEHVDLDSDHVCDYGCQVAIGEHADVDLDHDCDYCDGQMGTHADGDDANHLCDYGCGEIADDGCPADGNCDECSEDTSAAPDKSEPVTNAPDTNAADGSDADATKKGGNNLSPIVIIGIGLGAMALLGIGGFAIFWFVIRKRPYLTLSVFSKKPSGEQKCSPLFSDAP